MVIVGSKQVCISQDDFFMTQLWSTLYWIFEWDIALSTIWCTKFSADVEKSNVTITGRRRSCEAERLNSIMYFFGKIKKWFQSDQLLKLLQMSLATIHVVYLQFIWCEYRARWLKLKERNYFRILCQKTEICFNDRIRPCSVQIVQTWGNSKSWHLQ